MAQRQKLTLPTARRRIKELEGIVSGLRTDNEGLSRNLGEARDTVQRQENELNRRRTELGELSSRLAEAIGVQKTLGGELISRQVHVDSINGLHASANQEIGRLRLGFEGASAEVARLLDELKKETTKVKELTDRNTLLDEKLREARELNRRHERSQTVAEDLLDDLTMRIAAEREVMRKVSS